MLGVTADSLLSYTTRGGAIPYQYSAALTSWRQWLRQEEQKVQGSPLLAREFEDKSENSDRVGKQA